MPDIKKQPTAAAQHASNAATPPPTVRMRIAIVVGIAVGVLALGAVPVFCLGVAWLFTGSEEKAAKSGDPPQEIAKQQAEETPPVEAPPAKPKELPMSPEVRAAIDKGAEHLKMRITAADLGANIDNKHVGEQSVGVFALAGLALLEAKVSPDDPAIQKVLTTVRQNHGPLSYNYSQAACLFFLNRLDEAQPLGDADRQIVRTLALRMVAGQKSDGRWFYTNAPITPEREQQLLNQLSDNVYRPGAWSFGPGDNSQTQFAVLALWGSRKHDLPVRPALLAAAARFHQAQNADGSWGYLGADPMFNDSNTCAGLIALAMEKTLREDKKFQSHRGVDAPADPNADDRRDKAFARLAQSIGRTKDDPAPLHKLTTLTGQVIKANAYGDFYFLWCVERVGVIYDLAEIGGKDWYGWGSQVILQNQRLDGSWQDRHGDVCDTCFALLFLTRANLAKDLTESIRTRGGKQIVVP